MVDHEMHLVLHVLKNCADKLEENQALDLFQRKLKLFSEESLISMEESDEPTLVGSASDKKYAEIIWVDKYGKYLIHISTHTSISATSSGDENWEKEFSLLVPHEEHEAPIGTHDDLMDAPLPSQQKHIAAT